MVATLAGFIAVRALITLLLRPHYLSPVTVYYSVIRGTGFTPRGAFWQIAQGIVGPNGQVIAQPNNVNYYNGVPQTALPSSCAPLFTNNVPSNPTGSCAHALSQIRGFITYQPAGRFWAFQGIETGIFLVLTAALIAVTAMLLLRRDA
jgi:hypothetical protein